MRLLSGSAWLPSAKVGQVTLLDGPSAEVSAQVQVAPAGDVLDVVQARSTAYAVDQTAGTVRRVDGATYDLSQPRSPIPDAHAGLTAIAGPRSLYTLDTRRGILADTDPDTLDRRGELMSLANQLGAATATVDDAGTLWALDADTGNLTSVRSGERPSHRRVAEPGPSVITLAGGHPVVVDPVGRKAISIDRSTSRVLGSLDLDLRKDDAIQVSGSQHADRLYVVVGRGALSICDLGGSGCTSTIPLTAGSRFGAAVEAGNRLFVPDFTTGQVWVVDLTHPSVLAKPQVLTPATAFQLIARDGLVFFNDPVSERAGVIRLDGTVTAIPKYDPGNPAKGLQQPDQPKGPGDPPPAGNSDPPPAGNPNPPPRQGEPPRPNPGNPTVAGQPNPGSPQQPDPPHPLEVVVSKANPTVDDPITLQVNNKNGPAPRSARWDFNDGQTGDGVTTSHKWTTAKATPYLVTVTGTLPDGTELHGSANITVTAKPTFPLTVSIPGGGGTVTTPDGVISCPGVCTANLEVDTKITLTATPDASHQPGTWGGDCSGSTCDLTMTAKKNVSHQFPAVPKDITITVDTMGGGSIQFNGGPACRIGCVYTIKSGQDVTLNVTQIGTDYEFDRWTNGCADPKAPSCTQHWDSDTRVLANFDTKKFPVTVTVNQWENVGSVTINGVVCTSTCTVEADIRTISALDANGSATGISFSGWSGDCSGGNTHCEILMNGPKTVTATWGRIFG